MNPSDPLEEPLKIAPSKVFSLEHSARFLEGLPFLMETHRALDTKGQVAIFKYLGRHINNYPDPAKLEISLMGAVCHQWKPEDHKNYTSFFRGMTSSRHVRWIPRRDYSKESNPMGILLSKLCPDIALNIYRRAAFIPTRNRTLIIDNHRVILAPSLRRFFSENAPLSHSVGAIADPLPLTEYVDPILQFQMSTAKHSSLHDRFTHQIFEASFTMLWNQQGEAASPRGTNIPQKTSWLKTFLYLTMNWWRVRKYIYVYDYDLEYFDNPAVEALVEYKWNTMGFTLWLARFSVQCVYYLLIIVSAFLQVYYDQPSDLFGLFIVISLMAVIFLWFEFLQCIKSWPRYISSPYNVLDLAVYTLPLVASVLQMEDIRKNSVDGHSRVISFSIILIFFHLGGRYDSVSDVFGSEEWAFHIMMMIYFFFTVILMINFLIALVNTAFSKGDESWRLVLLENRLRYVEDAENMSFHIPGFRQTYDWFPRLIYYTAPASRVKDYRDKFRNKEDIPTVEKMSSQMSKVLDQLERIQDNLREIGPRNQHLERRPDDGYDSDASDLDTLLSLGRKSRIRTDRRAYGAQTTGVLTRPEELTNVQDTITGATGPGSDSQVPKAANKDKSISQDIDESPNSSAVPMQEQENGPGTSKAEKNTDERRFTLSAEETMLGLSVSENPQLAAPQKVYGDQMMLQLMIEIGQLKAQVSGLTASNQRQSAVMQEVFKSCISHLNAPSLPPVSETERTSADNTA
ncbi:hypothetical protein BGZ83_008256 [Gryganskiella cystojenkinii]|nr:hypothetical protein BGZ83_008256 [Gryganskiella cystojenkinii]